MSEDVPEQPAFVFKVDRTKVYNDTLRYVLLKILPNQARVVLNDLEKVIDERWSAFEAGEKGLSEKLDKKEKELMQRLIDMAKKPDA